MGAFFFLSFFWFLPVLRKCRKFTLLVVHKKKAFASLGRADIQKKGNSNLALLFKKIPLTTQLLTAYYQDIPAKQHKESSSESPIMWILQLWVLLGGKKQPKKLHSKSHLISWTVLLSFGSKLPAGSTSFKQLSHNILQNSLPRGSTEARRASANTCA